MGCDEGRPDPWSLAPIATGRRTNDMDSRRLTRRDFLRISGVAAAGAAIAACAPAAPSVVEVEKPVVVEKEVVREVPVEKVVEKEVEVMVTATPASLAVIRWQGSTSGTLGPANAQAVAIFNEQHPNIDFRLEPRPPGGRMEKLMAAMVAGVAPDIFEHWALWFAKYHQKGQLMDVQPFVDSTMTDEDIADFVPGEWDNFGRLSFIPGIRVAMPRYINWMWLHYNKGALDEAGISYPDKGWTVDDMAEAALKLVKRDSDGTITRYGNNFPSWAMERLFYHLERFGGAFVHHDRPKECLMGTPESQEALEWLRARYWDDESWAAPLLTERSWGGSVFTNEFCAMVEEGGPYYTFRDALEVFDPDFMHPPKGPKDFYGRSAEGRTSYMVTDGFGMWKFTKWPDAAWECMRFLSGSVYQELRMRAGGALPVLMSTAQLWAEAVRELNPAADRTSLHVPLEAFEMGYGRDDERFLCQSEAEEIINPLLEKIYIVGDTPVSVLADACAEVEASQDCAVM
jgi:ABC-type glycerol-3-phosphate transport system substrate-binding protein